MDRLLAGRIEALGHRMPATEVKRLRHPWIDLYLKMESGNPSGSAKDRAAYWILREAVRRGEVNRDTTVVESSSGNFAISLAHFCRRLGIRFVPVIDPNVNEPVERSLRALCGRVEKVEEPDDAGGFLLTRLRRVAELVAELDDVYWPNQYANPDGAQGHFELTGRELIGQLGRIDYLFVGVGTGATIAGLSQRITDPSNGGAVVAVDVAGSVIFGGPPRRRRIPGIGSSIQPPLVRQADIAEVVTVSEWDEVLGCYQLLREHGVFAGGSTGCVYTAVNRYFAGHRGPRPVVAFLCADGGEPYRDTVYDPDWVAANITATGQLPKAPTELILPA
ncbi:2,3-diaminopropionate biosynthesis protein SbnA [Streptomyces hyaluromycini]|uniref:N-(2-amino-2-carboxyethyl)-L-glutamate synthase n=1 Tax=Streptomyces hyaluromycini TaxID=1377993 RepID=A0ABV1X6E4_9ACTN